MAVKHYGGLIWTNHVFDRLSERQLSQEDALRTFRSPDRQRNGKTKGSYLFEKRLGEKTITLIAKQNEDREWVVVSVWVDPPIPGSLDARKKARWLAYKKATGWKRFWLLIKRQLIGSL